jgi:hypothetical protein
MMSHLIYCAGSDELFSANYKEMRSDMSRTVIAPVLPPITTRDSDDAIC